MNKIARFKQYSQNEELFHGQPGGRGETGSDLLDNVFTWLGDKFGLEVDILTTYLNSLVKDEVITEEESNQISKHLLTRVGGKNRDQIKKMVDELSKQKVA